MADQRDKIVQFVRLRGPLLPAEIKKEVNTDILFASAMLSELVDNKILKLSHLKVGGSPLYFAPGQEYRLQNFSDKLNDKDKDTYELLKKKIVLKDRDQEPLTRVSLRQLRDFAVPLEVKTDKGIEVFWKWYLTSTNDVKERIGVMSGMNSSSSQETKQSEESQVLQQGNSQSQLQSESQQPLQSEQTSSVQPTQQQNHVQPLAEIQSQTGESHTSQSQISRSHESQPQTKESQTIKSQPSTIPSQSYVHQLTPEPEAHVNHSQPAVQNHNSGHQEAQSKKDFDKELDDFKREVQEQVRKEMEVINTRMENDKESKTKKEVKKARQEAQNTLDKELPQEEPNDKLFKRVKNYFNSNKIELKSFKVHRKEKEMDFLIEIPSSVGKLVYFCKAKDKKTFNDGDLSSVFIEAQRKKMPILYLVTGDLTKKAQQMLETEFKTMSVKKL